MKHCKNCIYHVMEFKESIATYSRDNCRQPVCIRRPEPDPYPNAKYKKALFIDSVACEHYKAK